jgi:tRNA A37 threonylcarbamoyladenosine synthetase subunit TsaC/SUA5/YrdC
MLRTANVPVAAPSANKFGHVSPSKADHVYKDFHRDTDVLIIDGGECSFGIESTVLKLEVLEGGDGDLTTLFKLLIIRKGGISLQNLEQAIAEIGLGELVIIEQL